MIVRISVFGRSLTACISGNKDIFQEAMKLLEPNLPIKVYFIIRQKLDFPLRIHKCRLL